MAESSAPSPLLTRGSGRPVLFLHGYPLHRAMWSPQLSTLSARNRVALLDLPGYGTAARSAVPDTMAGFAEAVRAVVEGDLGGTATIVGHSFGGYVALQLYRDHPELFEGMVLLSTRSSADSAEAREKRLATATRLATASEHLDIDDTAKGLLAEATWAERGPVVEVVRAMVAAAPNASIIRTLQAIAHRPDQGSMLPTVQVPTLVVWGAGDRLIPPAQTQSLVGAIAGARGTEIPAAGHLSPLEAPARFDEAVRAFLEGTGGVRAR